MVRSLSYFSAVGGMVTLGVVGWHSSRAIANDVAVVVPGSSLHTGQDIVLRLLAVFGLIAINAFFVTTEFAIVSVRRSRINHLADNGDLQAKIVQHLHRNIERLLSTTQLGITLSSLALGWIGENTMAVLVAEWIVGLPIRPDIAQVIAHGLAIPLAFLIVAYLQIVLGELCPKTLALLYSEQLARLLGPPSLAIARFFHPFIWILDRSTRWLLSLAGIRFNAQAWSNRITPEELQLIIATERESTGLEAEERELLNNVFEFGEVCAREVMVPRTSIHGISYDATFQMLLNEVVTTGHSRYPVIGESLDDVRGIVYFKELAGPLAQGLLTPDTPLVPWIRPARFVAEYTPLSELLPIVQRSQRPMVMVVDEFGGTAGLVTISDLVAQIIGQGPELSDSEELTIQMIDEQTWMVQAQMNLEEVNELLNFDLPLTDEYQTLGGFLLYQFQKIPAEGETLLYDNLEFTVVSTEGPRLNQIRIYRPELTNSISSNLDSFDSLPPDLELNTPEQESSSSGADFHLHESEQQSSSASRDFDLEEDELLLSSSQNFDFYDDENQDEDEEALPSSSPDLDLDAH
ncbi:hemolysin family protein [Laspinema olomoucense]|uniref:Hemolysin family protein n=1 Tax=Laspinema olomoucense D3b TaxID=2953688 RepID=A0ABT2N348_9CYAN|nr:MULTISPECIES: hemolysin family protein [unclassified Laspinema]MCT7974567.1 hemolysin family protein [Laspinema sp. D3d]MCT7977082.1 hemolysin family protein [Laspinema sp. D3b]